MIVVVIEGGLVQDVVTDQPELLGDNIVVVDYDIDGAINPDDVAGDQAVVSGHTLRQIDGDVLNSLEGSA